MRGAGVPKRRNKGAMGRDVKYIFKKHKIYLIVGYMQTIRTNKIVVDTQRGAVGGAKNQKDIDQSEMEESKRKGWARNI